MNILFEILGVYFYLCVVSPVATHYIYADNPGTGYVSLSGGRDNHVIGFNGKQRRYMGLSNTQMYQKTNNERAVNSKITKSPTIEPSAAEVENWNNRSPTMQKTTESPKRLQKKEDVSYIQDPRNIRAFRGKSSPNQNYRSVTNARSKEYKAQTKQLEQNHNVMKGSMYDSKGNIVQVNVHKTPIPAEPQKVKLNNNRQLTALSVQRREDSYKRTSTSMLVDKKIQKGSNFKERNAQIMSRVLDDMTKKVTDRRLKNNEYKKRDTDSSYDSHSQPGNKRNIVSENMKKYIGKDINLNLMNMNKLKEAASIGNHEDDIEETNAPYALFYRMSPESLDNREGFYLMKSMEVDGDKVFSPKEKRLTVNYQNEVDLKKTKTKKNINMVKLRKKVKSFSKYRSSSI